MVLKMVGGILIVGACGGMGNYFATCLEKRVEELTQLYHAILELQGEIRYAATPLSEVMFVLGKQSQGKIADCFFRIGKEMEFVDGRSLAEIVRQTGEVELQKTCLTKQDKAQLFRLGDSLGRLDKTQQLLATEYYLKGLQREIEEAKRIKKERSYLYRCLSILTGVFLMILMI